MLMRAGLHLGIVVDEHRVDFGRGDFLVRNVLGGDETRAPSWSATTSSIGQTVQFHVRDAAAADEDLHEMLARASMVPRRCCSRATVADASCSGSPTTTPGSSTSSSGRSRRPARFCAGEIGPVAGRNFAPRVHRQPRDCSEVPITRASRTRA